MNCQWREKLDLYVDAELPPDERAGLESHLRECPSCAAAALDRSQFKHTLRVAAMRYTPRPEFRAKVRQAIAPAPQPKRSWLWVPAFAALAVAVAVLAFELISFSRSGGYDARAKSELVDLHVTSLASATPVDVVSTDSHTVKPWFAGRIPFTFTLPELKDTPFTLIGGRVVYFEKNPAAQLLFGVRRHRISVFVVEETPKSSEFAAHMVNATDRSFNLTAWGKGGVRYIAITDAGRQDLEDLHKLFQGAAAAAAPRQ